MRLGEAELKNFLIDSGLLTRTQLSSALQQAQGRSLSEVLVSGGYLGEDELRRASAHALGIPFVQLTRDNVSLEALTLIPEPLSRQRGIAAFALSERGLEVALLNLNDLELLQSLGNRYRLLPRLTTKDSMTRTLLLYQKHLRDTYGSMIEQEAQVVDALILHALNSHASEIVLDVSADGVLVRHRIGGVLREAMKLPARTSRTIVERLKTAAKIFPVRKIQEGSFRVQTEGEDTIVRLYALPTVSGERMSLHLLRARDAHKGYTLESLGLHGETLESLHHMLLRRKGLLLVAAPPGEGRSTLLYTLLDTLNAPHLSIATAERMVEHRLQHVAQTQVGGSEEVSMSALVRSVLRQDPDVLMVSDVADRETAALLARAASRGVFVIAGIEAADTADAIENMGRLGVEPELLSHVFCGAVSSRVVRTLSSKQFPHKTKLSRSEQNALEEVANPARVLSALKEEGRVEKDTAWKDLQFAHPVPSTDSPDGYEGNTGLYEVLRPSASLTKAIAQGVEAGKVRAQARKDGMLTMAEDGLFKAALGVTSIEEALR